MGPADIPPEASQVCNWFCRWGLASTRSNVELHHRCGSRKHTSRESNAFLAYISFFPQLVAGPIERAKSLLPQFYDRHAFWCPEAVDGLRRTTPSTYYRCARPRRTTLHLQCLQRRI